MMTPRQISFENVENALKLNADEICKNFLCFMNSRIAALYRSTFDKNLHPLKTGHGFRPKPLGKPNPIFSDTPNKKKSLKDGGELSAVIAQLISRCQWSG